MAGYAKPRYDGEIARIQQSYFGIKHFVEEYQKATGARKAKLDKEYGPTASISIDKFHHSFKDSDFPDGVSEDLKAVLKEAFAAGYFVARSQPWLKGSWMRKDAIPERLGGGPYYGAENSKQFQSEFLRRYHGYPVHLALATPGATSKLAKDPVIDWRELQLDDHIESQMGYGTELFSNFSNFPGRKDIFTWGTTHVAVGFNDLIVLLKSRLAGQSQDTLAAADAGTSASGANFRFVGIDVSAYSVAKTKIIWNMLMDKSVPIFAIIEVWFSSTWTREALEYFHIAVRNVVAELGIQSKPVTDDSNEHIESEHEEILLQQYVRLHGLQSEKGKLMNGKVGVVQRFRTKDGRWEVRGSDFEAFTKPVNLTPLKTSVSVGVLVKLAPGVSSAGTEGTAIRYKANSKSWEVQVGLSRVTVPEAKVEFAGRSVVAKTNKAKKNDDPYLQEIEPVSKFLLHWLACLDDEKFVSVEETRHKWYDVQIKDIPEKETYVVGCLTRKIDQAATLKYLAGGDVYLLEGQTDKSEKASSGVPHIGSVVMLCLPSDAPKMESGLALGCITTEDYLTALHGRNGDDMQPEYSLDKIKRSPNKDFDVMQLFTWFIKERIKCTVRVPGSKWEGEFIRQQVSRANDQLLQKIGKVYQPYTMSWSNVVDYMRPTTFHEVARICSQAGDTVHYAYSMNYPSETWGANIMDYSTTGDATSKKTRMYWVDRAQKQSLAGDSGDTMERYVHIWKLVSEYLYTKPFRSEPENLVNHRIIQTQVLDEAWIDHFMKKGEIRKSPDGSEYVPTPIQAEVCTRDNVGLTVMSFTMSQQSPFQRTNSPITFAWTYDPAIQCKPA